MLWSISHMYMHQGQAQAPILIPSQWSWVCPWTGPQGRLGLLLLQGCGVVRFTGCSSSLISPSRAIGSGRNNWLVLEQPPQSWSFMVHFEWLNSRFWDPRALQPCLSVQELTGKEKAEFHWCDGVLLNQNTETIYSRTTRCLYLHRSSDWWVNAKHTPEPLDKAQGLFL